MNTFVFLGLSHLLCLVTAHVTIPESNANMQGAPAGELVKDLGSPKIKRSPRDPPFLRRHHHDNDNNLRADDDDENSENVHNKELETIYQELPVKEPLPTNGDAEHFELIDTKIIELIKAKGNLDGKYIFDVLDALKKILMEEKDDVSLSKADVYIFLQNIFERQRAKGELYHESQEGANELQTLAQQQKNNNNKLFKHDQYQSHRQEHGNEKPNFLPYKYVDRLPQLAQYQLYGIRRTNDEQNYNDEQNDNYHSNYDETHNQHSMQKRNVYDNEYQEALHNADILVRNKENFNERLNDKIIHTFVRWLNRFIGNKNALSSRPTKNHNNLKSLLKLWNRYNSEGWGESNENDSQLGYKFTKPLVSIVDEDEEGNHTQNENDLSAKVLELNSIINLLAELVKRKISHNQHEDLSNNADKTSAYLSRTKRKTNENVNDYFIDDGNVGENVEDQQENYRRGRLWELLKKGKHNDELETQRNSPNAHGIEASVKVVEVGIALDSLADLIKTKILQDLDMQASR